MGGRVVALGASNLTRGFHSVVSTALALFGPQLEVLAALGHGRSYGMSSNILGRTLPGILQCGLWRAIESLPPAPTRALITDVGNDILYGAPVTEILGWVEDCSERLQRTGAELVMTDLPLASLRRLSRPRFLAFRSVLVPRCRLSLRQAVDAAEAAVEGLAGLASRRGATFFRLRPEWYGLDPIHIRPACWARAWSAIVRGGDAADASSPPTGAAAPGPLRLYLLAPERRRLFGFEQVAPQPCLRRDGLTLSLY